VTFPPTVVTLPGYKFSFVLFLLKVGTLFLEKMGLTLEDSPCSYTNFELGPTLA